MAKGDKVNLTESLKELNEIVSWFDTQEDVDVEKGLEKVRSAVGLIKASKSRLLEIENEFKEIEKEIAGDVEEKIEDKPTKTSIKNEMIDYGDSDVDVDNIPF